MPVCIECRRPHDGRIYGRCPACHSICERLRNHGGNTAAVIRRAPGREFDGGVLDAVRACPGTALEVSRRLGSRQALMVVVDALARLWADGLVTRSPGGVYSAESREAA